MTNFMWKYIPAVCAILCTAGRLSAQENTDRRAATRENPAAEAVSDVLPPEEWKRVDAAVGASILARHAARGRRVVSHDGNGPAGRHQLVRAGVHGARPQSGRRRVRAATGAGDRIHPVVPEGEWAHLRVWAGGPTITPQRAARNWRDGAYNHAIASLTLAEIYGMGHSRQAEQIQKVIDKSLAATLEMQRWPKDRGAIDEGGWRYINPFDADDSDLSITGWSLMFLRSARNAGFEVPEKSIDDAVEYVQHCFSEEYGAHGYVAGPGDHRSRGMAGAGILALAHAGYHDSEQAKRTGKWLLRLHVRSLQQRRRAAARPLPLQPVQLLPGDVSAWQPVLGAVLSAGGWPYSEAPGGRRFVGA